MDREVLTRPREYFVFLSPWSWVHHVYSLGTPVELREFVLEPRVDPSPTGQPLQMSSAAFIPCLEGSLDRSSLALGQLGVSPPLSNALGRCLQLIPKLVLSRYVVEILSSREVPTLTVAEDNLPVAAAVLDDDGARLTACRPCWVSRTALAHHGESGRQEGLHAAPGRPAVLREAQRGAWGACPGVLPQAGLRRRRQAAKRAGSQGAHRTVRWGHTPGPTGSHVRNVARWPPRGHNRPRR